jgi:hypothetical protein
MLRSAHNRQDAKKPRRFRKPTGPEKRAARIIFLLSSLAKNSYLCALETELINCMDTSPTEFQISPVRTAMTIGAIVAALMLVLPLLPFLNFLAAGIQQLIFIGGIYYAMNDFRKKTGGDITYGKACMTGSATAFFASLVMAFAAYVAAVFDPAFTDALLNTIGQILQTADLPEAVVQENMTQMQKMMTPVAIGFFMIMAYSFFGVFISFFCSLFVTGIHRPKQQSL